MSKNLLWIIPVQRYKKALPDIDLNKLNEIAQMYNFNANFVLLTNNKIVNSINELKLDTDIVYNCKVYDSKINLNTCIMKELENVTYDNVIVTNSIYTTQFDIMKKMLELGADSNTNFVHLKKKSNGFFSELSNLTSAMYNKIVKMFTGSIDKMFVRNCVMFNSVVLEMMQDFPNNSAIMRETNYLALTSNKTIDVDKSFKTTKMNTNSITLLITSILLWVFTVGLFVIICAVKMNIDLLLWLLVLFIVMIVVSIITSNYSVLKDKIRIDNFYLDKTKDIEPITSQIFNQKSDNE